MNAGCRSTTVTFQISTSVCTIHKSPLRTNKQNQPTLRNTTSSIDSPRHAQSKHRLPPLTSYRAQASFLIIPNSHQTIPNWISKPLNVLELSLDPLRFANESESPFLHRLILILLLLLLLDLLLLLLLLLMGMSGGRRRGRWWGRGRNEGSEIPGRKFSSARSTAIHRTRIRSIPRQ